MGVEFARERRVVEAREHTAAQRSIGLKQRDRGAGGCVAAPRHRRRDVSSPAGLAGDEELVRREALVDLRREDAVAQGVLAGERPVRQRLAARNVRVLEIRIVGLTRRTLEVEAVHAAAIIGAYEIDQSVVHVVRERERHRPEVNDLSPMGPPRRRRGGVGITHEQVVEGAILLDDDHDVCDAAFSKRRRSDRRRRARRHGVDRRGLTGARRDGQRAAQPGDREEGDASGHAPSKAGSGPRFSYVPGKSSLQCESVRAAGR